MQRVREFLRDILRQTDLVLLALCCTATAYGILMIYSATRYMNTLRLVLVQTGGAVVGIILFFLLSLVDIKMCIRDRLQRVRLCADHRRRYADLYDHGHSLRRRPVRPACVDGGR